MVNVSAHALVLGSVKTSPKLIIQNLSGEKLSENKKPLWPDIVNHHPSCHNVLWSIISLAKHNIITPDEPLIEDWNKALNYWWEIGKKRRSWESRKHCCSKMRSKEKNETL